MHFAVCSSNCCSHGRETICGETLDQYCLSTTQHVFVTLSVDISATRCNSVGDSFVTFLARKRGTRRCASKPL